jgi:FkbM family methyltransferase
MIHVGEEYAWLNNLDEPKLILDLGANVGYSATLFLSTFPNCFVIAVEPDPDNFKILEMNLAPYHGRFTAIQAAVWPESGKLSFAPETIAPGNEWGRKVEHFSQTVGQVEAVDILSLVRMTKFERISLLKIDIEGAEEQLFSRRSDEWLNRTDTFCVELHGEASMLALKRAIDGSSFTLSSSGELTIGSRVTGNTASAPDVEALADGMRASLDSPTERIATMGEDARRRGLRHDINNEVAKLAVLISTFMLAPGQHAAGQ